MTPCDKAGSTIPKFSISFLICFQTGVLNASSEGSQEEKYRGRKEKECVTLCTIFYAILAGFSLLDKIDLVYSIYSVVIDRQKVV